MNDVIFPIMILLGQDHDMAQPRTIAATLQTAKEADEDVAMQVIVPRRIKHVFGVGAGSEGATQRTFVLRALKAFGFGVDESGMFDRRNAKR